MIKFTGKWVLLLILFTLSVQAQPVIDGDMSDALYNTLGTFTSGRNGFGNDNDFGFIKYYANGTDIYIGITGETVVNDNVILFFDFSGYDGRGSNTLTAGGAGVFQNIGGAKMDFDVDYALAFNKGNTDDKFYLDACRYGTAGVIQCNALGNTTSQLGVSTTANIGPTFGGAGNITYAFHNNFPVDPNKGIEFKIPIAAFAGVTSSQAFRVFAVFASMAGFFSNECVPGDPGANNLGNNADFSAIAGQNFYTNYAPMVYGITFNGRLDAGPLSGCWMGDFRDNTPFKHDNNCGFLHPCGGWVTDCGNYAYSTIFYNATGAGNGCINGSGRVSFGNAVIENTDIIDGVANVTIDFDPFQLSLVQHLNWGAPAAPPNGIMGDHRTYTGGIGRLKVNGVTKLQTTDTRLSFDVDYAPPQGKGDYVQGFGWGTIDPANSDPNWVAKYDNGNGQVQFDFYSFSPVEQNVYGVYDYIVILRSAENRENVQVANVVGNGALNLDNAKIRLNITANSGTVKKVMAREVIKAPTGAAPVGIETITDKCFWQLGTTLDALTTSVTFDISGITGISNTNNLRILKRDNSKQAWAIYSDYTLPGAGGLTTTQIRANNVTSFSDFTIGSTSGNPLPVQIEKFSARTINGEILISWTTATEVNNMGFELQSRKDGEYGWKTISFISGAKNSNSPKSYSYKDKDASGKGVYYYRLKQIDTDGTFEYSETITLFIDRPIRLTLHQNRPNPFNPETLIRFEIPEDSKVILKVFNAIGQEVSTIIDEEMKAGIYSRSFNGKDFPSGTYFYTLTNGDNKIVKKMILIK